MRIIAGKHRGREIQGPDGQDTTRPITDRIKESLFNRLHSLGMLEPKGFTAIDLFSGTGSMGIEALSRGAGRVIFVDQDRVAARRLKENLETLNEIANADIRQQSAWSWAWLMTMPEQSVTMTFLDPPFEMMRVDEDRMRITQLLGHLFRVLEDGGVVLLRGPSDAQPIEVDQYDGPSSFEYGKSTLHFYQRPLPDDEDLEVETQEEESG